MGTLLVIVTLAGALAALAAGVLALRAYLGLRRTRVALLDGLIVEVVRLAGRAAELETRLAALDARANALPVRISDLQQNLTTLRTLTNALTGTLGQAQRVLSPAGLKSSLAKPLAGITKNLRNGRR
jgi:phage shock protein A